MLRLPWDLPTRLKNSLLIWGCQEEKEAETSSIYWLVAGGAWNNYLFVLRHISYSA
jgi:hypothetical protein